MPSKSKEKSCPICFTEKTKKSPKHIRLHCGSSCCQECLVEWFVVKIKETPHDDAETQVPCIFSGCKGTLQVQKISSQLLSEYQTRINEELFQAYLNNQQDVRRCPRENCPYAGIITLKPCGKDLHCELCSETWTEKIQQTKAQRVLKSLKSFFSVKNEILSQLWKLLYSKRCPSCKSAIIKNQGCDHITCLKCSAQFCWQCPSRYPAHDITIHRSYLFMKKIIFLIIAILVIWHLGGFAYLIPPVRFVLDWTVIPVWKGAFSFVSWIIGWIVWGFYVFRNFFVFNAILTSFANTLTPSKKTLGARFRGFFTGCLLCFIVYYFGIFWSISKFGCCELALGFGIKYMRNRTRQNKKKLL